MLRLSDNPPITLPTAPPLAEVAGCWTAVYTKPRQEKALAWDLCQREIAYFLPMVQRETSSGGRRRHNLYPLYASYLFFAGDDDARLALLKTNRALSLIEIDKAEQSLFRTEIASLDLALRTSSETLCLHSRLVKGAWVRVKSGPLAGAEGNILRTDGKTKLLLGVTIMGTGATVEIHPDLVEPWQRDIKVTPRSTVEVAYVLE